MKLKNTIMAAAVITANFISGCFSSGDKSAETATKQSTDHESKYKDTVENLPIYITSIKHSSMQDRLMADGSDVKIPDIIISLTTERDGKKTNYDYVVNADYINQFLDKPDCRISRNALKNLKVDKAYNAAIHFDKNGGFEIDSIINEIPLDKSPFAKKVGLSIQSQAPGGTISKKPEYRPSENNAIPHKFLEEQKKTQEAKLKTKTQTK